MLFPEPVDTFSSHKYNLASELYAEAIELKGGNAIYWANQAFTRTKLEDYVNAIKDASKAIKLDRQYSNQPGGTREAVVYPVADVSGSGPLISNSCTYPIQGRFPEKFNSKRVPPSSCWSKIPYNLPWNLLLQGFYRELK